VVEGVRDAGEPNHRWSLGPSLLLVDQRVRVGVSLRLWSISQLI